MVDLQRCTCGGSGIRYVDNGFDQKVLTECICKIEATARLKYGRLYTPVKNWITGSQLRVGYKFYINANSIEILDNIARSRVCPILYTITKHNSPWLMLRVDEIIEVFFQKHPLYNHEEELKGVLSNIKYFILIFPATIKKHDYGMSGIQNLIEFFRAPGRFLWIFYEIPGHKLSAAQKVNELNQLKNGKNKNNARSQVHQLEGPYGSHMTNYLQDFRDEVEVYRKGVQGI